MKRSKNHLEYQVEFQGRISQRWTDWFGNMHILKEIEDEDLMISTIAVRAADQAEMMGTLNKMHNLGYTFRKITLLRPERKRSSE